MADEKKKKSEDEVSGKAYDARLMRRLACYLGPYRTQATISVIAVILKAGSDAIGPYLLKVGLDRYLTSKSATGEGAGWLGRHLSSDPYQGLWQLTAIYLCALLLAYAFEFTQTYLMQWTGQKVMFDLRREIFRHMQRMHIGFFDNHAVGRLVTRLTSDVDAINEMFTAGVLSMIDDVFALTVMVVVMLSMNWRLALLTLSVLPAIGLVTHLFRKSVRESYRRVRGAIARINSFTQEHVSGMSVVQLFNREERAYTDFRAVNEQHMIAFKDTIFAYALYYPAVDILSSIAIAFILWRGGFGVIAGGTVHTALTGVITIGVLSAFIQYSQRFFRPIMDLSEKFNILQAAMAACERIFKLLDTPSEIVSPTTTKTGDASNRIEFRNVWFTYQPLTPEQQAIVAKASPAELAELANIEWILKDVSFTIEPGQTVAIVGHTGAGKTTLTGLMMRFYDVTRGQILLDGVDLREQDLEALRRHFAVVLQDPFLFTGAIAENIRLGAETITDERMTAAARDVNVLEFIQSLPGGFNEPVLERGSSLSTGQKQLINFARALAYDPRILILDEATSSVDTETEQKIRSALERMVEGRTSVLIAHRLSTVQRADAILVMHKGQLREFGSHQQLLAKRGIYYKLYQLQYKDQEQIAQSVLAPGSSLTPELAAGD
ncbi:MAG TPA: ABC transporter ATP-binding protein [Acidobacteriaceae bacterium]|nr:ABC transporter ATP-binding protein [Acidobacteriaceae bacterium]